MTFCPRGFTKTENMNCDFFPIRIVTFYLFTSEITRTIFTKPVKWILPDSCFLFQESCTFLYSNTFAHLVTNVFSVYAHKLIDPT